MSYSLIREILEEPWNPNGPSTPTGANPNANGRRVSQLRPMLRSTELIVAICIAIHADNDTRMAWPGIERLARMTRRSRRAVYRAISSLRRMGVLEIVKGGAARFGSPGDLYKFNDPVLPPMGDFATTGKSASSGTSRATSGTESVPPVALKLPEGTTMNSGGAGEGALLIRCRAIFRIRPTSKLDTAQGKAWRKAAPLVVDTMPDEWAQLESYYSADIPTREDFRRRDLATLLNNWSGEVTRARDWCTKVGWRPTTQAATVPEDWRELVAVVLKRDHPDAEQKIFSVWSAVPGWLQDEVREAASGVPADWQQLLRVYVLMNGYEPTCMFDSWEQAPDYVRDDLRALAAEMERRPAPEGWGAAIVLLQDAGKLPPGDAFEAWPAVSLWLRAQVCLLLEKAEEKTETQEGKQHENTT